MDTPRSLAEFLNATDGLFKNNLAGEISAQDLRDFTRSSYQPQGLCDFRLGLEQNVPVSTADQSDKTTLYVNTCARGNRLGLPASGSWVLLTPSPFALGNLTGLTTNKNHDVFAAYSRPVHSGTDAAANVVTWAVNPGWTTGTYVTACESAGGLLEGSGYFYRRLGATSGSFHGTLVGALQNSDAVDLVSAASGKLLGTYCDLGPAWSSNTARATDLTVRDGVYVNATATSGVVGQGALAAGNALYLGTVRTVSTSGVSDTVVRRYVWNNYNRAPRSLFIYNASAHSYGVGSWRYWNNSLDATKLEFVIGISEPDNFQSDFSSWTSSSSAEALCYSDIDTGSPKTSIVGGISTSLRLHGGTHMTAGIGYHYSFVNEYGGGTFNEVKNEGLIFM